MSLSTLASAFVLGVVLASSPGPVQAVLLAESSRGRRRGFAAMAGANGTFAVLLGALASGLGLVAPTGGAARLVRLAGGLFLLLLAADTVRSARRRTRQPDAPPGLRGLPPAPRGILAVVLNPGAWVFIGTTAAALIAGALRRGGRGFALVVAGAMLAGVVLVDGLFVVLASAGGSRLSGLGSARVAYLLAGTLAVFGLVFVVSALPRA